MIHNRLPVHFPGVFLLLRIPGNRRRQMQLYAAAPRSARRPELCRKDRHSKDFLIIDLINFVPELFQDHLPFQAEFGRHFTGVYAPFLWK